MTVFKASELDTSELTQLIKDKALELGYADVGISSVDSFDGYREEIESRPDYERMMGNPHAPYNGATPSDIMPDAQSIISVVYDFSKTLYPKKLTNSIGRVYLSRGYLPKPNTLNGIRRSQFTEFLKNLGIKVDESGPMRLPERLSGARAGLVTFGANNFVYAKNSGSFVVLTAFLVNIKLAYDTPSIKRPCPPDCEKCVTACPTGALYAPGKLSYKKCLLACQVNPSRIEQEMRPLMGLSIHGCDLCQEVCPRNKSVIENASHKEPFLERVAEEFDLEKVLLLDDAYYERVIYPLMYNYITEKWLFQRNAAIALGNSRDTRSLAALKKAKETCPDEVQEYIDWAVDQITLS